MSLANSEFTRFVLPSGISFSPDARYAAVGSIQRFRQADRASTLSSTMLTMGLATTLIGALPGYASPPPP